MSIVVAVKKGSEIVIASDTKTFFGSNTVSTDNHQVQKFCKIGESYLAFTGPGLYHNILEDMLARRGKVSLKDRQSIFSFFMKLWKELHQNYPFVQDQCDRDDHSPFGDLDASFLVVNRRGIYFVASDMSITEFDRYFAIGHGADFSLGALHALYDDKKLDAKTLAERAVKAALEFSAYCGGDVSIGRLKLIGRARRSGSN